MIARRVVVSAAVVHALMAAALFVPAGGVLLLAADATLAETGTQAPSPPCKDDEIPVPDERERGGTLCLAKAERERAKAICEALAPGTDPLGYTCQDGDTIGACGD